MGSEASERMMALLSELAALNELDRKYQAHPAEFEQDEHRVRLQRHAEITQDIKALAAQKKKDQQSSAP